MENKLRRYLPAELADKLIKKGVEDALEIRLRAGKTVKIRYPLKTEKIDCIADKSLLEEILQQLCGYSLYAYSDDISRGFITAGGWRVGIGGRVSCADGSCRGIKNISSLNIRIARQIKGCADGVLKYLFDNNVLKGTLIASPPACGKTTLVRDIARQLSNMGSNTAVIDERGEIAALGTDGIPCFDVGENTDILSGIKKSEGAEMALRSLAPQVMVLDEIGGAEDMQAVYDAVTGGCTVVCTAHTYSIESLYKRKNIYPLIKDGIIERIIFLSGAGMVEFICGERGEKLWQS
ncbi:MAG: stage III sporulation protein AA [Firmicutes bacterium]|nr:stage III sporulation protein AA [Bacillota bacterium]